MRIQEFNLLSESFQHKRRRFKLLPGLSMMVLLAVICITGAWWFVDDTVSTITTQADSSLVALENGGGAKSAVASSAEAQRIMSSATKKINTLNQLAKVEIAWPKAFSVTESLVQKDIVLSSMTYTQAGPDLGVQFSGSAPSSVSFANYIEYLRQNSAVKKVSVENFNYNATIGTVGFSVSLSLDRNSVIYTK